MNLVIQRHRLSSHPFKWLLLKLIDDVQDEAEPMRNAGRAAPVMGHATLLLQ